MEALGENAKINPQQTVSPSPLLRENKGCTFITRECNYFLLSANAAQRKQPPLKRKTTVGVRLWNELFSGFPPPPPHNLTSRITEGLESEDCKRELQRRQHTLTAGRQIPTSHCLPSDLIKNKQSSYCTTVFFFWLVVIYMSVPSEWVDRDDM